MGGITRQLARNHRSGEGGLLSDMEPITESSFEGFVKSGDIVQKHCVFLDGLKIGLRINLCALRLPQELSVSKPGDYEKVDLSHGMLTRGEVYLARTCEQIAVSSRVVGFLHTRSRWARLGLDCLGSSNYLSPGFGAGKPTPIVLELKPSITLRNADFNEPVAALILFHLSAPVRSGLQDHRSRFPLDVL